MFGYDPGEVVGKTIQELLPPEIVAGLAETHGKRQRGEAVPAQYEVTLMRKDGTTCPVEFGAKTVEYAGKPALSVVIRDITERKQAEEEVLRKERYFRSLIENAQDVVEVLDEHGIVKYESPAIERVIGYTPEERVGQPGFLELAHPDDLAQISAAFAGLLENPGSAVDVEARARHKDGTWHTIKAVGRNLLHDPAVAGIVANFRDITDRKRAEELIQHKLELERTVSRISSRFVGTFDIDDAINAALAEIGNLTGADRAHLFLIRPDGAAVDNIHEWCADGSSPRIDQQQGLPWSISTWVGQRLRKGEVVHIRNVSRLPKAAHPEKSMMRSLGITSALILPLHIGGRLAGWIGLNNFVQTERWDDDDLRLLRLVAETVSNALERTRAEEELQRQEQYFRSLIENSSDVILIINGDGSLRYTSPSIRHVLGRDPEERTGESAFDYLHPDDEQSASDAFTQLLQNSGAALHTEARAEHQDGSWKTLDVVSVNLLDDPVVGGIVVNFRDITDRKEMEEALRESEEKYRNVVERANDGIVIIQDSIIKYVNSRAADGLGYTADQVVGTAITDYIHPDELATATEQYQRRMAGEEIDSISESVLANKDGDRVHVETNAALINYEGRPANMVILRNISERKQMEEALRVSEAYYRLLAENVTDIIWTLDMDLQYTYMSPSVERLRGFTPEEAMSLRLQEAMTPASFELALQALREELEIEKTKDKEFSRTRKLELEMYCSNPKRS
jgi:PAS domain S-box-containing protein